MVSKIGKNPVGLLSGVTVDIHEGVVVISGPKGSVTLLMPVNVRVVKEDSSIKVEPVNGEKSAVAAQGLTRSLLANAVNGVTGGWSRSLELVGTGYRAALSGASLTLSVGFSHPVVIEPPEGIGFGVEANKITVFGVDKQKVGKMAAELRAIRPPEPYKGKGIKYIEERVRRKAGKAAKAATGAAAGK